MCGVERRFALAVFFAGALVLLTLPFISAPHVLPEPSHSIAALVVAWAGYHVLEYIAAVALWSWFGDLVPGAIRGRFVGRRQGWTNAGKAIGTATAAIGTYYWLSRCDAVGQPDRRWLAYAACGLAGAMMFVVAILPLCWMVDLPHRSPAASQPARLSHQIFGPWADRKFRRLLFFGLWFSFSNALMQPARWIFQTSVLHLSFTEKKALDSTSRGVQSLLMPLVGDWVDRHGNVRVLACSQAIIALAPLFFSDRKLRIAMVDFRGIRLLACLRRRERHATELDART